METTLLYRPVGKKELELIRASGYKEFPPRLPEQVPQELDDLLARDIVWVQTGPQPYPPPAGCDHERPDHVDPLVMVEAGP